MGTLRKLTTHVVKYRISQVKMFCQIMVLSLAVASSEAMRSHLVFWNTTNPMFRVDNTDHILDVNQGNLPWEYDQVNIICPFNSQEKHVIYSVSKEEFDSCRVSNPRPKIVAICDKPQSFKYFTITFRSFSPIPGGLEFKPGQDVYFISTSNRNNVHRKIGGFCSSHNMKMVFKVADNREESNIINVNQPRKIEAVSTTEKTVYFSARVPEHRQIPSEYTYYTPLEGSRNKPATYYRNIYKEYKVDRKRISALPLTSSSSSVCSMTSTVTLVFTIMLKLILL